MFTHDGGDDFTIAKIHGTSIAFDIKLSRGCGGGCNDDF
jgi:hypothetical protein